MILSDGDFEFIFSMYDAAIGAIPEKDKLQYATDVVDILLDNGVELKDYVKEISDHCEYLSEAVDSHFQQIEEDEDIFEEWNEDELEDWG